MMQLTQHDVATYISLLTGFPRIRASFMHCPLNLSKNIESSSGVKSVAYSPDGDILAFGSAKPSVFGHSSHTVNLLDTKTGHIIRTLGEHGSNIYSLTFSPDGKQLASGSDDSVIKIWDMQTNLLTQTFEGAHNEPIRAFAFSPNKEYLASASSCDGVIKIWDLTTGNLIRALQENLDPAWLRLEENQIIYLTFSSDETDLISESQSRKKNIWDLKTGTLKKTIKGHRVLDKSIAYHPYGIQRAFYKQINIDGKEKPHIKIFDGTSTVLVGEHDHHVNALAFSPDGKLLASGADDGMIKIWDISGFDTVDQRLQKLNYYQQLLLLVIEKSLPTFFEFDTMHNCIVKNCFSKNFSYSLNPYEKAIFKTLPSDIQETLVAMGIQ